MALPWATMDVEIASARSASRPLPGIRRAVTATVQQRLAESLHRLPFECVARKAILWEGNAGRTRIPHAPNWSGHLAAEHDSHCSTNYEVLSRESFWGPMMRLTHRARFWEERSFEEASWGSAAVKAVNHGIRERRFPSWEGEAPAEPQNSHNGVAGTGPQVVYDRCWDGRCRVDLANKACSGGNPLHAHHASLDGRLIAFRPGGRLALPTYGFVHVRTLPMRHRDVSVSQSRTVISGQRLLGTRASAPFALLSGVLCRVGLFGRPVPITQFFGKREMDRLRSHHHFFHLRPVTSLECLDAIHH